MGTIGGNQSISSAGSQQQPILDVLDGNAG